MTYLFNGLDFSNFFGGDGNPYEEDAWHHGTGIFTYVYHQKPTIHVGKYASHMDGMVTQ